MEKSHKDLEVVPTVNPKYWPKTLETAEDYIRVFHEVYGQPLIYGLSYDLIAPVAAHATTYHTNGSDYFTHNEEMIDRESIISGHAVLGTDPEEIGSFTDTFITNRALIWDKIVAIFQG